MILTCPHCATRYLTDGTHFAPGGRNVRCAKCGHVWFQTPPGPETEPEPEPVIPAPQARGEPVFAPALEDNSSTAIKPRRSFAIKAANGLGWAALVLLVVALGVAGVKYRQTIATLWPQTASVYSVLGMPVNVRGLEFVGVTYQDQFENGEPVLAVSGKLVNVSAHELAVPAIRVSLSDNDGRELYHWTFNASVATLAPGLRSDFTTRLTSPPREARHVDVSFARTGE